MSTCLLFVFACLAISAIAAAIKAHHDQQLMLRNPEAWTALKQHEADEKERKHRATKAGVETGLSVFKIFFGK